jgi:hypothetical protein
MGRRRTNHYVDLLDEALDIRFSNIYAAETTMTANNRNWFSTGSNIKLEALWRQKVVVNISYPYILGLYIKGYYGGMVLSQIRL